MNTLKKASVTEGISGHQRTSSREQTGTGHSQVEQSISRIRLLLADNKNTETLNLLDHSDKHNDAIANAYGVCLMRLGRHREALGVLRTLAFKGLPAIASEVPAIIQANYATALLLTGDNSQAIDILSRLRGAQHPYVDRLKQAISRFRKELGPWGKLQWAMTLYPSKPLTLDFPPGDL